MGIEVKPAENGNGKVEIRPTGLVIGLPFCGRLVTPQWAISLSMQQYPINTNRFLSVVKGKPIDEARNTIAEFAVKQKAKYVWFLDDDVVAPLFAVKRLIYDLEMADDDVMVAGAIYSTKDDSMPEPCVFQGNGVGPFWKWKKGDVFECTGIGTGCMVIKTEVFEKLEQPWFRTVNVSHETGDLVSEFQSDDLYFCDKVTKAGYKILADGNVICIHWDVTRNPPKAYMLPENSYPLTQEKAEGMIAY